MTQITKGGASGGGELGPLYDVKFTPKHGWLHEVRT